MGDILWRINFKGGETLNTNFYDNFADYKQMEDDYDLQELEDHREYQQQVKADILKSGKISPIRQTLENNQKKELEQLSNEYQDNKLKFDFTCMPGDNLIMRYVDHQAKRSDAYQEYHFGSVLFIISTLTNRNARTEFKQGIFYPNIWCMNLGASSISRKSTAINAAEELLLDVGMVESMPNGFSPESFIEIMADDPHNYLIADEAGSILSAMQKHTCRI